jgi:dihydroorotate dehydrogenase
LILLKKLKSDIIATNTTISREEGLQSENKTEMGGLSGKPLAKRATEVIRFLSEK